MTETAPPAAAHAPPLKIRKITADRPWAWLTAGWSDLSNSGGLSYLYGAVFALVGAAVTVLSYIWEVGYLVLPFAAGFLLIGPIAAVGLYEISRRRGTGEPITLATAANAWRRNSSQLAIMTVVLLALFAFWLRIASIIFVVYFPDVDPTVQGLIDAVFFSEDTLSFLLVGNGIGGVFAAAVFAVSAISIPLLTDRPDAHIGTAIITSVRAVEANVWPMAVWAVLIALFIGAGIATGFLGLVVTLPLIGHATWHAYRDLVED